MYVKTYGSRREGENKSEIIDIHYREMCKIHETVLKNQLFGTQSPEPAEPPEPAESPEVVSASAAQTSLPHAPGVRMTGVKQTPSN